MFHGGDQRGIRKEIAVLNHRVDPSDIHVHDSAGINIEVANFAVAHLSIRQSHKLSAGMDQSIWIFAEQSIVGWLAGESNRIGFGLGAVAPSIKDDEYERFGTQGNSWFACCHFAPQDERKIYRSRSNPGNEVSPGTNVFRRFTLKTINS